MAANKLYLESTPRLVSFIFLFPAFVSLVFQDTYAQDSPQKSCYRIKTDRFQLALIYDRSYSYAQFGKNFFNSIFPELHRKLSEEFPGSEFAITTFADYTPEQYPKLVPRLTRQRRAQPPINTDKNTGCYQRHLPFTERLQEIKTKFNSIKIVKTGGSAESSLTAIYLTVADINLKWREAVINMGGKLPMDQPAMYKMIVLLTEEVSTTEFSSYVNQAARSDPKGDGTDSCTKTKIPTPMNIKQILSDNNITGIVAILNRVPARPEVKEIWEEYFNQFGSPSRTIMRKSNENGSNVAQQIINKLKEIVGSECVFEEEDPTPYNTLGL